MQAELADREDLLDEVVTSYFRAVGAGQTPDRGEWLARYPDLAADLNEFFADQNEVLELAAPLRSIALTPEAPGQTFGDFETEAEIGRGGMGVVYRARQKSLNRTVALKVLPFAATMDARALQRFHNEAQAAAGLHHTNIVPVYFVGCEHGVHYYAMQFIEGADLASVLAQLREQRGRPRTDPPKAETLILAGLSTEPSTRSAEHFRTVARLGIQAAEALDHAHQQGIVHRDVKPANLIVDVAGQLWVTDFGLAQVQSETRLTMTGDLVGTLRYMSPEQALAKRLVLDHRTDVYSLGATLYELLTLEPAFDGKDRQELLRQIAFEEPRPPRRVIKAIPTELETIVLKAMEKNATDRYSTAQEVADDLRSYLEDRPIRARRPSIYQRAVKWCKRHVAAVVAAAAVSFLAAVCLAVAVVLIGEANAQKSAMLIEKNQALQEKDDALGLANTASKQEAREKAAAAGARDRANAYLDDAVRITTSTLSKRLDTMNAREVSDAGNLIASAVDLQEKAAADSPDKPDRWHRLLQLTIRRSEGLQEENRFLPAIAPQKRVVEVCRHWIAAFPNDRLAQQGGPLLLVGNLVILGGLLCITGQLDEGEKVYAEALDQLRQFDQRRLAKLLWTYRVEIHVKLGCARAEAGRHAEAAQAFDKALALIQERKPDVPPRGDNFDSRWYEAVQWRARYRIGLGKLQLAQGRPDQAVETFRGAVADFKKLSGDGTYVNDDDLEYAWFLVTCPVKEILNSAWAMELANKAIEQEAGNDESYHPRLAMALRVRGLAHYLGGDWAACSADLNRALTHRFHYDVTRFILTIADARLGDKKKARGEYERGVRWTKNNRPKDPELRRVQAEAAALLGVKDAPPTADKKAPMPTTR